MAACLDCGARGAVGVFCSQCGIRGTTIPCGHHAGRGPILVGEHGFDGLYCGTCADRVSGRLAIQEAEAALSSRQSAVWNRAWMVASAMGADSDTATQAADTAAQEVV